MVNVTNPSIVDTILQWTFVALDDIGIGTSQSQRIHALSLQAGYQRLVHQTAVHHRHHFQHGCVRDAASVHHLRFQP